MDSKVTNGLTQHWVRTVDAAGRERLEARWISPEMLAAAMTHAA